VISESRRGDSSEISRRTIQGHHAKLHDPKTIPNEELAGKRWVLFQRQNHPPLYDLIRKLAQELRVIPSGIQHFMVPEESIPLLNDPGGVVIVGKYGALRIARDGLTMRPLDETKLMMNTLLISGADNGSKVISELVRNFMRRMNYLKLDDQMSLPISV
jgi:hypothetical protein